MINHKNIIIKSITKNKTSSKDSSVDIYIVYLINLKFINIITFYSSYLTHQLSLYIINKNQYKQ